MKPSVIGFGYLGAVHAAAMASIGHEAVGIDVDEDGRKIATLAAGEAPSFAPGLPEILTRDVGSGNLRFATDMSEAPGARVPIIGVGTPQQKDGYAADLTYRKLTGPVGTATALAERVSATGAKLVWNPKFLRESWAVQDTFEPDRLIVGVPATDGERAADILREVYCPTVAKRTPFLLTDLATAELVKVAANAFLATNISFINAMAEIAEVTGADLESIENTRRQHPQLIYVEDRDDARCVSSRRRYRVGRARGNTRHRYDHHRRPQLARCRCPARGRLDLLRHGSPVDPRTISPTPTERNGTR
ncbi:hypothetical protein [Streptomyces parvus]|uniref:hypothetical protein n=1 Tax=Streptomyces parvus TaxID=66428 RepID=UPI003715570E